MNLPTPLSSDAAVHIEMVQNILAGQYHLFVSGYPQGFHLLMAGVAIITGQSALTILMIVPPLLVICSAAAVTYLGWVIGGRRTALITGLLYLTVTVYPLSGFLDGNYPNLLAGGVLAPLWLAGLIRYLRKSTHKNLMVLMLFGLAIILTHHLTAAWLLTVTIFILGVLGIQNRLRKRPTFQSLFRQPLSWITVGLLGLAALLYWPALIAPILAARPPGSSLATVFGSYLSQPLGFGQYREYFGDLPWVLSGLGLAWIVGVPTALAKQEKIILVTWTLILFLLSRTPAAGIPTRFARELAIPMVIVGSYFLADISQFIRGRWQTILAGGVGLLFLGMNLVGLMTPPIFPDNIAPLVTFTRANADTARLLADILPADAVILATPSSPMWDILTKRTIQPLTKSQTTTTQTIDNVRIETRATYIILIPKPDSNPSEQAYPYFADSAFIYEQLAAYPNKQLIRGFSDGSVLFKLE